MLKELVAEKRAHPQDDLISIMATTVEDGERLSETEMLALLSAVLAAGPDTTRDHLANLALVLALHPHALQTLHDHPERVDDIAREGMRWRNFRSQRRHTFCIARYGNSRPENWQGRNDTADVSLRHVR
jgi:cytochrome P450